MSFMEDVSTDSVADSEPERKNFTEAAKLVAPMILHGKIGSGTFSTVWLGSTESGEGGRRLYAVKQLLPTAHPRRILAELRCLRELGGRDHVVSLEACVRDEDAVLFVMPYAPHDHFAEYAGDMGADETREYMRALFQALRHVHAHGIIHRDVKPGNFLYDRRHRRYMLVDFGLAQEMRSRTKDAPTADTGARKRTRDSTGRLADSAQSKPAPQAECCGRGTVCARCLCREVPRAPRAGTPGFRPPEVLLRCTEQTTAVDMWACGVMLLSVLSGRYPVFRACDDASALAEVAALLGSEPLRRAAAALGRRLDCGGRLPARDLRRLQRQPDEFPDTAWRLVRRLLSLEPGSRISAAAALHHPFLRL